MTIKAIQTRYAGCHFRSRLEARWAVFFDHLSIPWEYEHEGYELPSRIWQDGSTSSYLPDFWFPDLELHGEVKGELRTDTDVRKLIDNAAALSCPTYGCGSESEGHDVVIFGRVPGRETDLMPTRLHMHKGELQGAAWWGESDAVHSYGAGVAGDWGEWSNDVTGWMRGPLATPEDVIRHWFLEGSWACSGRGSYKPDNWLSVGQRFRDAYTAARSARFEHGETPERPTGLS